MIIDLLLRKFYNRRIRLPHLSAKGGQAMNKPTDTYKLHNGVEIPCMDQEFGRVFITKNTNAAMAVATPAG